MWEQFRNHPRWSKQGIKDHYYKVEGGHVNDANDSGGATGAGGITTTLLNEYKKLWPQYGYTGDYRKVPYALTMEIFDREFWDKMWLDDIWEVCPVIADIMYGWALNAGRGNPVKCLQRHICIYNKNKSLYPDIGVDGGVGGETLRGLNNYMNALKGQLPLRRIIESLLSEQWVDYSDLAFRRSKDEAFIKGWHNRRFETEDAAIAFDQLVEQDLTGK